MPHPKLTVRKKLLFSFLVLAGLFLACELGVRIVAYSSGRGFLDNPRMFTSPFITHNSTLQPEIRGETFVIYGRTIPRRKDRNEIRVLCFGGSTTENPGIERNYPDQLEERLAREFPGHQVRVLNVGRCGYSSAHFLVNFSLRCLDVQPDIITVYENVNDLSVNYFGEQVYPDYANKYLSPYYLSYHHRTGFWAEALKISRFLRLVDTKMLNIRHEKYYAQDRGRSGL